jgi:hypothetical protein
MRPLALLFLTLIIASPVHAWTRVVDQKIALKAAALAPSDLRTLIDLFDADYKAGIARAQEEEGHDTHRYFVLSRQGKLREKISFETTAAVALIKKGAPMRMVVERLGYISHFVADANNPFHVANDDAALNDFQDDFERYLERRLSKFPTVFYGLDEKFQLTTYLDRTFARSSSFYPLMREEYFRDGERHTSADFDDRSTAFGVASVSYSRAVTDIVNLYFHIWREAGGDVRSARVLRGGNLIRNP